MLILPPFGIGCNGEFWGWLVVANEWRQEELGKIATTFSGGTPKVSNKEYYQGKIPFIRSAEVNSATTELFISESALGNSSAKLVTKGTILYALYGATSGEVGIAKLDGAINQAILAIIPNRKNDVNFLYQDLKMMQNKIVNKYLQGGQGNLSGSIVQKIPIKFPPYAEQNKVGIFLSQLDNLITLHEEKLSHLETLKRGMLQELFPDKGDVMPVLRHEGFYGEWSHKKLSDIATITMGQSPKGSTYSDTPSDYILVQGNADMENGWVKPRVWTTQVTKQAEKGDLILSVRAPAGEIGKTAYDVVLGRGVAAIKGNEFLFQTLYRMNQMGYWKKYLTGSTFEALNSDNLKNATIKVPNKEEQKEIASLLKQLDLIISSYRNKLAKLQSLKKFLLQNLFI